MQQPRIQNMGQDLNAEAWNMLENKLWPYFCAALCHRILLSFGHSKQGQVPLAQSGVTAKSCGGTCM